MNDELAVGQFNPLGGNVAAYGGGAWVHPSSPYVTVDPSFDANDLKNEAAMLIGFYREDSTIRHAAAVMLDCSERIVRHFYANPSGEDRILADISRLRQELAETNP